VDLIKRVLRWAPPNLPAAFVVTAVIGAVFSIAFLLTVSASIEPRSTGDSSFSGEDLFPLGLIALAATISIIGLGLAIFGILPTLGLRRFHDRWWTWLIAAVWGGVSGIVLILLLTWHFSPDISWATGVCGASCGLLWRLLAGRTIKRQADVTALS
jgi:hypothetical protein